jgi:hypothetical protein
MPGVEAVVIPAAAPVPVGRTGVSRGDRVGERRVLIGVAASDGIDGAETSRLSLEAPVLVVIVGC